MGSGAEKMQVERIATSNIGLTHVLSANTAETTASVVSDERMSSETISRVDSGQVDSSGEKSDFGLIFHSGVVVVGDGGIKLEGVFVVGLVDADGDDGSELVLVGSRLAVLPVEAWLAVLVLILGGAIEPGGSGDQDLLTDFPVDIILQIDNVRSGFGGASETSPGGMVSLSVDIDVTPRKDTLRGGGWWLTVLSVIVT